VADLLDDWRRPQFGSAIAANGANTQIAEEVVQTNTLVYIVLEECLRIKIVSL
jgi:hypothetical protein